MSAHFGEAYQAFLPPRHHSSIRALEGAILVQIMKFLDPDFIFEFGTFEGDTTRLLLENMTDKPIAEERLYTLDRPKPNDFKPRYRASKRQAWVRQIAVDSLKWQAETETILGQPEALLKKFQLIFIDAGHDEIHVRHDTENALKMLQPDNSCMIWHDYAHPGYPELTRYLDGLSKELSLYHVAETGLVLYFTSHRPAAL